jgi:3-oxoacyl-[acyl-carrier protein] reductase
VIPGYDLTGKVALVTGGSRGIGLACAKALHGAGARVALGDLAFGEESAAFIAETEASINPAWAVALDITDSAAVKDVIAGIGKQAGRLDILINNAGRRIDNLALVMKDEEWRASLAVNLDGTFYCCRAALALMRKGGGSIVNISSIAAFTGSTGQVNYAAAKAGVAGLTRSLAVEYGGRGIRVNCVVPGVILTPMTADMKPEYVEDIIARIPLKRLGLPEEVAQAVLFLASDAASYISGACLHINGGGYPA